MLFSFVFTIVVSESKTGLVKPTIKTNFSIKWDLKVIQGQPFQGHWKADKALRDAA